MADTLTTLRSSPFASTTPWDTNSFEGIGAGAFEARRSEIVIPTMANEGSPWSSNQYHFGGHE
ncbi:hypothetical protein [Nocardia terpenica]|uniref:Uncharacterized protein n=1 Tax=Nocardia terpenica TaxID=455432 RepID=A0A6G9Z6Z6_9NOCA|nr:hypothetical protein [Nocardia terpenica]QIS21385.1 hypothetical protein F6W96_26660 [Nocardia terpenica]